MGLNPLEKLDTVLFAIKNTYINNSYPESNSILIMPIIETNEISNPEHEAIIRKLISDGYLEFDNDSNNKWPYVVKVTYAGLLFEGYVKQREYEEYKLLIATRNENRKENREKRLVWGTWFAGIAAFLLLLWQLVLWFYPNYSIFSSKKQETTKVVSKK